MAPIITPLLLVCIGLAFLLAQGFRGAKRSRETGPNTLMHFLSCAMATHKSDRCQMGDGSADYTCWQALPPSQAHGSW